MRTFSEIQKEYREACANRATVISGQIAFLERQLAEVTVVIPGITKLPAAKPNGAGQRLLAAAKEAASINVERGLIPFRKRKYTKKSKFWKKK
jgi:hypothetical protein